MASLVQFNGIGLPELEDMSAEDARKVRDWMYQVQEQLSYILTHLGPENFNEKTKGKLE